MTRTQQTAVAAGAITVGAALVNRALRAARTIDFRGKSVLITGGSRGLGLCVARQLGEEGAQLTLAARDAAELDRARDELAARDILVDTVVCNLGVADQAARLVGDVVARAGRIDVLINNAGIIQVGPLDHMTVADFEEAMAVHFWG